MNEKQFTRWVKEALENIPVHTPDDAWEKFFTAHNTYFIEDKLSNAVYQGLTNLPHLLSHTPDWVTFRNKYESQAVDEFFKDSLSINNQDSIITDWASFSTILAQQEADELDDYLKESLESVSPSPTESAWSKFHAYLENRIRASIYIVTSRILEVIAMIFIVWSLFFLSGDYLPKGDNIIELKKGFTLENMENNTPVHVPHNSVKRDKIPAYTEQSGIDKTLSQKSIQKFALSENKTDIIHENQSVTQRPLYQFLKVGHAEISYLNHKNIAAIHLDSKLEKLQVPRNSSRPFSELINVGNPYIFSAELQRTLNPTYGGITHKYLESSLPSSMNKERGEVVSIENLPEIDFSELDVFIKPTSNVVYTHGQYNSQNSFFRLYFNQRFDFITTPYDEVYDIKASHSIQPGYGAGFGYLSRVARPFYMGVGIEYNRYNYSPPIVSEVYGSLSEGLARVSLNRIKFSEFSIPVDLQYIPFTWDRWSVMASAGATIHLVSTTAYAVSESPVGQGFLSVPVANVDEHTTFYDSDLSTKSFGAGLFHGGSLKQNIHARANIGIGAKYKLSERYNLFFLTTYNKFLGKDGIGPNGDRLDAVNLKVGIEYGF